MIKGIYKSMKNIEKRPSTDVAYLKGSEDPQLKADVKKAISTHHATGNNLLNVLYNKDKELYKKLDAMGTTNAEQFINQLAYGEDPVEENRKKLLELEKARRSKTDSLDDNSVRLEQAKLLEAAGFNTRKDFDEYLKKEMPTENDVAEENYNKFVEERNITK